MFDVKKNLFTYSFFISVLKIVFPGFAFCVILTLFLFSPSDDFGDPITVKTSDIKNSSGYKVKDAKLSGRIANGNSFTFSVESINPYKKNNNQLETKSIAGSISFFNHEKILLKADLGVYDHENHIVKLHGNLKIEITNGLKIIGSEITADLENNTITSNNNVKISNSALNLSAGSLKLINRKPYKNKKAVIWFQNGVKIEYKNPY